MVRAAGLTGRRARWQAAVAAATCGLVLALLTAAVFSIASRSRQVASQSLTLNALNETLRSLITVRAQVAFAVYLSNVDSEYGTDSRSTIAVSLREVGDGLASLEASAAALRDDSVFDQPGSRATLSRFVKAARRALALVSADRSFAARRLVGHGMADSFTDLRGQLVARRDDVIGRVDDGGRQLGRLGGLASFLVAFVLPSVAILVYRQVTRRSKETVETAFELAQERGRWRRRRQLVERSLAELRTALASGDAAAGKQVARAGRLAVDVETLVAVLDGTQRYSFQAVPVGDLLDEIAVEVSAEGVEVVVDAGDEQAWVDPAVLRHVLRNIAFEVRDAGARWLELRAAAQSDGLELEVRSDGALLPADAVALVFERAGVAERAAVEAGAGPIRLVVAQELLEGMGGALSYVPGRAESMFVARVPAHERTSVPRAAGAASPGSRALFPDNAQLAERRPT